MNRQEDTKSCCPGIYRAEDVMDVKDADNILKAAALFLFLFAAISQWFLGYYAADYYDDSPTLNGLQLGHVKASRLEIPNKNFMDFNFICTDSLIKFDLKK